MTKEIEAYFEKVLIEEFARPFGEAVDKPVKPKKTSGSKEGRPPRTDFTLSDRPLSYAEKKNLSAMIR